MSPLDLLLQILDLKNQDGLSRLAYGVISRKQTLVGVRRVDLSTLQVSGVHVDRELPTLGLQAAQIASLVERRESRRSGAVALPGQLLEFPVSHAGDTTGLNNREDFLLELGSQFLTALRVDLALGAHVVRTASDPSKVGQSLAKTLLGSSRGLVARPEHIAAKERILILEFLDDLGP